MQYYIENVTLWAIYCLKEPILWPLQILQKFCTCTLALDVKISKHFVNLFGVWLQKFGLAIELILANFRNFTLRTMILKIEKWTKRFGKLQTLHMVFSIQESDWVQIDGVAGFVITAYSIHTNECYLVLVFFCLNLAFRP